MTKLKVGVAGAGVFGNYHAQKAAASARTEFMGVYDIDQARAESVASTFGAPGMSDYKAFLEMCDAIVVAVPATFHEPLAREAIEAHCHVLVEKPLTLSGKTARSLADEAAARGRILQVGHQERFVARAMGVLSIDEAPLLIESVRAGPPAPDNRAGDVSVIWDLMIHDLDLAAMMLGTEFNGVTASGKRVHSRHLDEASAQFTYASGGVARLRASRAAEVRERTMRVVYPSGEIAINFLTRKVENSTPYEIRVDIAAELPDPLGAADEGFYAACLGLARSPVPAHGAVAAVAMAEAAEASALAKVDV
ncbi:Gfo/Idh/MocA family protein [Hyphomonas oceanitis]|uniref:Gfo/Idh/MocA family oxidoreductase n=1 Tax=Hyphomonas oceanitis SCH89 TaxID=1280953 RepID=A0A059G663_9PROT|nr:Gfo/Idh/MocA family oxidoreductase [Hyphomonas oceanitis]KDA02224.1 Gfo/Idh/MocA family oxidoreductase [Hyphomonas oceanitis SCH89]|tara:strand:- start:541 stop:1464 length:924 start_codon:yes stop_codon:yes gene_type:complete